VIYKDGKTGHSFMKRFFVNSITRDKEYDLTTGKKGSTLLYFACHPNGEREVVTVNLRARTHLKKLRFDLDLGENIIKSRSAKGNIVSKETISKITQKEVGGSTLAARKIWYDDIVGRLNDDQRGKFLGHFRGDDKILTLYKNGEYRLSTFDLTTHFDDDMIHIEKWNPEHAISAVYYDAEKDMHYAKRFVCEVTTDRRVPFISEAEGSHLDAVSTAYEPEVKIIYNKLLKATKHLPDRIVRLNEFIDVKGMKSIGNQLEKMKTKEIELTHEIQGKTPWPDDKEESTEKADEDDSDDDADLDDSAENDNSGDDDGNDDSPKGKAPKSDAGKEKDEPRAEETMKVEEDSKPLKKVKKTVKVKKKAKEKETDNSIPALKAETKVEEKSKEEDSSVDPEPNEESKTATRKRSLSRRPIKDKPSEQVEWDLFSSSDDNEDKNKE